MSPLARMLLALACLALLHAASAEKVCTSRVIDPDHNDELSKPSRDVDFETFFVNAKVSTKVYISNACKPGSDSDILYEFIEVCNNNGYELEIIPSDSNSDSKYLAVTVNCKYKVHNGYRLPCSHTEYELEVRGFQFCV